MRLNLGCGSNWFPNWLNVDIDDVNDTYIRHLWDATSVAGWPEWQQEQWRYLHSGGSGGNPRFRQLDFVTEDWVTELDCAGRCDAIYLGQVVEHVNPIAELPDVLLMCHAALKPGGVLRITTPDLKKILNAYMMPLGMTQFNKEQPEYYAKAEPLEKLSYLLFGATGPNSTRRNYEGHHHCWYPESLARLVRGSGFTSDIDFSWPSKRLTDVRDFGESHSFALEVCK